MKKILLLLFILPFFAKAQVPTLSLDTTYKAKANQTGVLLVTDVAYFTKLANADTLVFAQFDAFGKLAFRRVASIDTQFIRRDINLNTSNIATNTSNIATNNTNITTNTNNIAANTAAIATKQPLGSYLTANQAITVTATGDATGTSTASSTAPSLPLILATVNATIGTFTNPTVTVNAKGLVTGIASGINAIYQVTAVPFANASGILISDSTKLSFGGEYLSIATTSAAGTSGILLNQGRAEVNGQFSGMYFNVGSGKAAGGVYDASKGYVFQNRGNTIFQISTSAISAGVNTAAFTANVTATGTITSAQPIKAGGYTVATLPTAGIVGRVAYVTDATAPTYLGALTGGGTVKCPVFDNGVSWVSH